LAKGSDTPAQSMGYAPGHHMTYIRTVDRIDADHVVSCLISTPAVRCGRTLHCVLVGGYETLTVRQGSLEMERNEVSELHFITAIANLDSILRLGIVSHDRAARIQHTSCANEDVQDRRRGKRVPNGERLHSYANLYFHARNPMMYTLRKNGRDDLVVVRVSQAVLDIPETVITDGNAASDGTRFYPSPEGLASLDSSLIFAKYWTEWTGENYWPVQEKKRARNAEVLVPEVVGSDYIEGCYVDTGEKRLYCRSLDRLPSVTMRGEIFFR
jgi:ssDNA thymidine ADP-ribosyltransferase, DarT